MNDYRYIVTNMYDLLGTPVVEKQLLTTARKKMYYVCY